MKLTILSFLLAISVQAHAQCGFDQVHQWLLTHDQNYEATVRKFNSDWADLQDSKHNQKMIVGSSDTTYEIPLVLHVMHNGEPLGSTNNPSDSQLIKFVDYVNATYAASWPAYPVPMTGGVNTHIRFVLAKLNANCNAISGIQRVNASSVPGYTANGVHSVGGTGPGVPDTLIRKLSYWDWTDYLNIWIVHKIDLPLSGYAGSPYYSMPNINSGVVILAANVFAGNTTLIHELGHCLGLYHTFEGDNGGSSCPSSANCTKTGDLICDTDPDRRYPDCSATTNPCTSLPYAGVQFNFMNYSGCTVKFTADQRDRMQFYLSTFWYRLRYSRAGDSAANVPMTVSNCITTASGPAGNSQDGPILVSFNGIYRVSQGYYNDGSRAYVDNTCNYRTQVTAGSTYPLTIAISGSLQKVRVYLDYNNDGIFQVPGEEIYSATASKVVDTLVGNIKIPTSGMIPNKPLRMRVVCDASANSNISPCGALLSGQAEDYGVTIIGSTSVKGGLFTLPRVYPNPMNNYFSIDGAGSFTGVITNCIGQNVMQFYANVKQQKIDVSSLPAGMYILQLTGADGNRGAMSIMKQ